MSVLWPCFALSGAAALALELLWMRSAALVLGGTATTTATVLACYFAGLAGGAAAGRAGARHPVRRYGRLELGAAAGALWSLGAFRLLATGGAPALLARGGSFAAVLAIAAATLPATLCLGATLPALGQALAGAGGGRRAALLYALNTAGGVAGTAAMGFGLPAALGVRASYLVTAAASAVAGAVALRVGDRGRATTGPDPAPPAAVRLRVAAAATGFLGLALEVLWTRLFAQVLHNSVYSFAAVALVFLLALAAGAALAGLVLRRRAPLAVARAALAVAGAGTLAGVCLFAWWTDGLAYVGMRSGLAEYVARIVGLAALTAGPGALAAGAVLPALWAAFGTRTAARALGDLTAANTAGAILGALAAAFVALPVLGLRASVVAAAVAYVVLAELLGPAAGWRRAAVGAVGVAVVLLVPGRLPLTHLNTGETLRATIEGPAGIVTVVDGPDDRQLRLDNYYVLGGSAAVALERRQGLLPLLLHPDPRRVAFVGLATGISASAAPALGVPATTVVELVPAVAAAARAHFAEWNAGLLDRPDVRLVLDDGRRWLAATPERFDAIVSDLFIPWHAGTGSLYAREMYATVARRLAPGGLFAQWLPLYQLTREEFDTIARTFLTVFPHATLWRDDFYADRPIVALVGQLAPRPVTLERIADRLAALPAWARDPLLASPRAVAMLSVGDLAAAADLFAAAPVNTDDRPVIEFRAPRLTRMTAAGDKDWFTGEALGAFYDQLAPRLADAPDPLLPTTDDVRAARRAGTSLYHYALAATRGDRLRAAAFEDDVRRLVPDVVLAGDHGAPDADLAAAERDLAALRTREAALRHRLEKMERRLDASTGLGETSR